MNLTWGRHDEPPVLNAGGGGGGLGGTYQVSTSFAHAAAIRLTRPNNVTAYAAGQVYGDAVDARMSIVVPAMPANSRSGFLTTASIHCVQSAPVAAGACQIGWVPFSAQPATVLGDQQALALSDADIALIPSSGISANAAWTFAAGSAGGAQTLNQSALSAGRRGVNGVVTFAGGSNSEFFTPGATVWFYLQILAAYTPQANETLDLYIRWVYTRQVAA